MRAWPVEDAHLGEIDVIGDIGKGEAELFKGQNHATVNDACRLGLIGITRRRGHGRLRRKHAASAAEGDAIWLHA